jgi:hypothetical protein
MLLKYKGPSNNVWIQGKEYPVIYFYSETEKYSCNVRHFGIIDDEELVHMIYYGETYRPRMSSVTIAKKKDMPKIKSVYVSSDDIWEIVDSYVPTTWTTEYTPNGRLLKGHPFKNQEEWAYLEGVLWIGPPECAEPTKKDALRYHKAIMSTYEDIIKNKELKKIQRSDNDCNPKNIG